MAYAAASDVGALCRNLLGSASDFSTSSSPTLAAVTTWLSSGCAGINGTIGSRGYGVIPATSGAYDIAKQANAIYAAWMAESSRTNARTAPGDRTRADNFKKDFQTFLDVLKMLDLSSLGVTQTGRVWTGGISVADKDGAEGDTDRVVPRFNRGQFRNTEAREPSGTDSGDPQARTNDS